MKQIYIKTVGYLVHLHGYGSARTPVRFNIKEKHLDLITKQLKAEGIQFELYDYDESILTLNDRPPDKKVKQPISNEIDMKLLSKIIKKVLSEVVSNDPTIQNINEKVDKLIKSGRLTAPMEVDEDVKKVKKRKEKQKEQEEDFIPGIAIDEMKMSKRSSFRIEQIETNLNEAADMLKKVTK